jgi:hypothetical protein
VLVKVLVSFITVKVKKEAKKVGTVERVMRQSTAIPEPSFWLVRSGDAKIDCRTVESLGRAAVKTAAAAIKKNWEKLFR